MTESVERVDPDDLSLSRREVMGASSVVAGAGMFGLMTRGALAQQGPQGEISGTVTDAGGPAQGATVDAVPHDSSLDVLRTTTDASGEYVFDNGDLHDGENLYHVICRDGTESSPRRGQENYPFVSAEGFAIPDSGDLQAHYDASDKTDVSTTFAAAVGPDLSAVGSPSIVTDQLNGNNVARYDGSSDGHEGTFGSSVSQPVHIFGVFQFQSLTSSADYAFGQASSNDSRADVGDSVNNEWSLSAGSTIAGGSADTNAHVINAYFDGSNSYLRVDGTEVVSGDAGSDSYDGVALGWLAWNNDNYANVDIGEYASYPESKQSIEGDVEQYLADKWGITL